VLLDEMEKAHPQVLNVLLQLLDDGRITDSQGRTVDCTNSVFIMTSNIGSEHLMNVAAAANSTSKDLDSAKEKVLWAIRQTLRPELLNRLDDVIVFNPLSIEVLRQVVRLQITDVVQRLQEMDVQIHITDAAVDHVLQESHDAEMGARPMKRYLERHLVSHLSRLILKDQITPGSSIVADWTPHSNDWSFRITQMVSSAENNNDVLMRTSSTASGWAGRSRIDETQSFQRADSGAKRPRTSSD
jgi:ATP-dependent Clp protease ATP-binding subunit ClpB